MIDTKNTTRSPLKHIFYWLVAMCSVFVLTLAGIVFYAEFSVLGIITLLSLFCIFCLYCVLYIKNSLELHVLGLANVIESLRRKEYAMRLNPTKGDDAWAQIFDEIDKLANTLRDKQITHVESGIILDKLLAEFDVPVFVFDKHSTLSNINHAGLRLFDKSKNDLIGLNTQHLGLDTIAQFESGKIFNHWFPNKGGRWELRKNYFIQHSSRYTLLLVNDLSQTLREEERIAWQRLLRVLGHELNNSLASIISVSDNLVRRLGEEKNAKWTAHYKKSMLVINERSQSLSRFAESYTKIGKLPPPNKNECDLLTLVTRVSELLEGEFEFRDNMACKIDVDADQIEQMLINLLKNAVEASSKNIPVVIKWQEFERGVRLEIIDKGIGLPQSDNLFVPFFSTKENGNGIGLFLCRQIAEAHGGSLALLSKENGPGCIARCWLPK